MSNDELTVFQLYSLLGSQFFTLPSSFVGDCLFWAVFDYNFKKKKKKKKKEEMKNFRLTMMIYSFEDIKKGHPVILIL